WPARPGEVPGAHRPGRKAGALVVLSAGKLVLYVERGGKTLLSWTSDPEVLVPAAAGLAEAVRGGALGRLTVGPARRTRGAEPPPGPGQGPTRGPGPPLGAGAGGAEQAAAGPPSHGRAACRPALSTFRPPQGR